MLNSYLTAVGALAVGLGFASKRIQQLPLSEPLVALVVGVVAGPRVLGVLDLAGPIANDVVMEASRLLLAVSLMAIALRFPPADMRARLGRTALLVAVVMPGMAAISAVLGGWILGLSAGAAWLLGAAVSPTDPVLASNVVTGAPAEKLVPARVRELLSLESGANDGLAFPMVVLGITLVQDEALSGALLRSLWAVLGAVGIGVALGWLAGRGIRAADERNDVDPTVEMLFTLVVAVFVLGASKLARTDGVLAVFVAGLAYNIAVTGAERLPQQRIDEAINRFAVLPTFVLLGVVLPWAEWARIGWPVAAFAIAVLVLHRLPLIALLHRPLAFDWPTVGFYGWFGPVGASALFYLAHARHEGVTDPLVWAAGTAVIAASTILHGVSAMPGRRMLAAADRRPEATDTQQ